MKYRKKAVEVEAVQWTGRNADEMKDWFERCAFHSWRIHLHSLTIVTTEGVMEARPGDWIIRGVEGEFYPCKPTVFAATYDEIAEVPA